MRRRRPPGIRPTGLAASLLVLLGATGARAEPTAADKTLAAALFREGKALLAEHHVSEACGKLAESQRLDPGGGTLLNVALCHEMEGRVATAWSEFIEAQGLAKRDHRSDRVEFAQAHIDALEPTLPRLTMVLAAGADEPGLGISRDGTEVGRAAWGSPIPLDPGEHQIRATAPGKIAWQTKLSLGGPGEPKVVTVTIPALAAEPASSSAAPAPVGAPRGAAESSRSGPAGASEGGALEAKGTEAASPDRASHTAGSSRKAWGYAAVGVGAAGLGVSTVLTVMALSKKHDADTLCPSSPCSADAVELSQDAGRLADYATVSLIAGLGFAGVGAYLLLSGPSTPSQDARLAPTVRLAAEARPGGGGVRVVGEF
jgi:hypothetical protein